MSLVRIIDITWLLISIFALGIANAQDQKNTFPVVSWQKYKSVDGRFSIEFPSNPVTKITHQESVIGHITNHVFESKTSIGRFTMDYSDLPGFAVAFTGNDTIYSHARGGLLKKTLGKVQSSKDILFHGHSGKYLIYDIPQAPDKAKFVGQAYIFLIDKRLYIVNAISPSTTPTLLGNYFLNSLRFY